MGMTGWRGGGAARVGGFMEDGDDGLRGGGAARVGGFMEDG
jgi:hypothetical protein